jgi:hypothetical protein
MSMNQYRRPPAHRGRPGWGEYRPPYYWPPYGRQCPFNQPCPYGSPYESPYGSPYGLPYGQVPYEQPYPYQQPYPSQPTPSVPQPETCPQGALPYTVQSGDTLENIASRLGITANEITALNPRVNFSVPLQNGQSICLPSGNE